MLADIQRLQTLLEILGHQLQDARLENETLRARPAPAPVVNDDAALKQALQQSQLKVLELQQQLNVMSAKFNQLADDTRAHAQQLQTVSAERDSLAHASQQWQQEKTALEARCAQAEEKNVQAKRKVEAIIQRLASLGQPLPADAKGVETE